jgi:hypothetical protein
LILRGRAPRGGVDAVGRLAGTDRWRAAGDRPFGVADRLDPRGERPAPDAGPNPRKCGVRAPSSRHRHGLTGGLTDRKPSAQTVRTLHPGGLWRGRSTSTVQDLGDEMSTVDGPEAQSDLRNRRWRSRCRSRRGPIRPCRACADSARHSNGPAWPDRLLPVSAATPDQVIRRHGRSVKTGPLPLLRLQAGRVSAAGVAGQTYSGATRDRTTGRRVAGDKPPEEQARSTRSSSYVTRPSRPHEPLRYRRLPSWSFRQQRGVRIARCRERRSQDAPGEPGRGTRSQ